MYLIKIREIQITVSQMRVTACDTVDFAERVVPVVLLFLTGCPALVFICCLHAVTRSEQIYVCALQELCLGFLQVLFKPAKGLIFLVLNSGLGCLIWGANPSLPREHFSTNDIPSSSGFLIRGELLLSSYQIPPGPLYIGLVVEEMSC